MHFKGVKEPSAKKLIALLIFFIIFFSPERPLKFTAVFRFQEDYKFDGKECSRMTRMIKYMKLLILKNSKEDWGSA